MDTMRIDAQLFRLLIKPGFNHSAVKKFKEWTNHILWVVYDIRQVGAMGGQGSGPPPKTALPEWQRDLFGNPIPKPVPKGKRRKTGSAIGSCSAVESVPNIDPSRQSASEQPTAENCSSHEEDVLEVDDDDQPQPASKRKYTPLREVLAGPAFGCIVDSHVEGKLMCNVCSTEKEIFLLQKKVTTVKRHVATSDHRAKLAAQADREIKTAAGANSIYKC